MDVQGVTSTLASSLVQLSATGQSENRLSTSASVVGVVIDVDNKQSLCFRSLLY